MSVCSRMMRARLTRVFTAGQLGKELCALCTRNFQTVAHLIDLEIVVVTAERVQFLLERTVAVQQAVVVGVLLHLGFQLVHRGAYLVRTGKGGAQASSTVAAGS